MLPVDSEIGCGVQISVSRGCIVKRQEIIATRIGRDGGDGVLHGVCDSLLDERPRIERRRVRLQIDGGDTFDIRSCDMFKIEPD